MKQNIHPKVSPVTFMDGPTGERVVISSTLPLEELTVDVSAFSHPFWVGNRVERPARGALAAFERRYGQR